VEALASYGLDWWLPHVREVCDQFVRASKGDINPKHWRDIYKREDAYGWDVVNGWLVKLVPYLKNWQTGNFTVRNPLLADPGEQVSTDILPSGISQVPFRCRWQGQAEDAAMEFLDGFVGVTQDALTLALRPKLGWAVRKGSDLDRLFARLSKFKPVPPLDSTAYDQCINGFSGRMMCELSDDFLSFYKHCNGVSLFGDAFRFRPLEAVEPVEGITTQPAQDYPDYLSNWDTGPWVRFCDLADGSFVVIELRHTYERGWKMIRVGPARGEVSPIVAWSFAEFLEKALSSGGRLDMLEVTS